MKTPFGRVKASLIYEGRKYLPKILQRELKKESGSRDLTMFGTIARNRIEVYLPETDMKAFLTSLFLFRNQEEVMKKFSIPTIAALMVVLVVVSYVGADFQVIPVKGQFTSWDKKIPGATRFQLVLDGAAVLDKETGLVWEKSPDTGELPGTDAIGHCYQREVGNRKGWRLPTVEELASLVDNDNSNPALPSGHPFDNVQFSIYNTSTISVLNTGEAYHVYFSNGSMAAADKNHDHHVWCGRGRIRP